MNKLKKYFSYRKFGDTSYRILFLFNDYLLQKESVQVLQNMGHRVIPLAITGEVQKIVEKLLKTALEFKPDCIMSINHIGFDTDGHLTDLLAELSIPAVVWYVDDFRFIIGNNIKLVNKNTAIFTFEKNHIHPLREMGFDHVFYLPTGTPYDCAGNYSDPGFAHLSHSVTFVGNTFAGTKKQWAKPEYEALLNKLERKIDFRIPHDSLFNTLAEQKSKFTDERDFFHYAGFVAAHATMEYRRHFLKNLQVTELQIFGDESWHDFDLKASINKPVDHLSRAPQVFRQAQINLNLSSRQLETAVNQRVFDVPAAGGFLLTDWRESLTELFDPDEEMVCFSTVDEMNDLIRFYKNNPERREKISNAARKRVAGEHLLRHRLTKMLHTAKYIFNL